MKVLTEVVSEIARKVEEALGMDFVNERVREKVRYAIRAVLERADLEIEVDRTRGILCPWCPPSRDGRKVPLNRCSHNPFELNKKVESMKLEIMSLEDERNGLRERLEQSPFDAVFERLEREQGCEHGRFVFNCRACLQEVANSVVFTVRKS